MSSITYRSDVAAFLLSRLAEEFCKPRISKLFGGIGTQYQALEDAAWQLYTRFARLIPPRAGCSTCSVSLSGSADREVRTLITESSARTNSREPERRNN